MSRPNNQDNRRAASDAVNGAQQVFSMYPMASNSHPSAISQNMATMTTSGRPASYSQPQYYSTHPPPYSEVDYSWPGTSNQAVHLLQQQQLAQPHMQPQLFPSWTPPVDQTSSFQPSQFAQSVLQQTVPSHAYPTPPPPSGPIMNSPASSSLAYALTMPPQQFLNSFVDDRAAQLLQTPKKRKSTTDLESPTIKRTAPSTPTSVTTPSSASTSVPVTPSTGGTGLQRKRTFMAYVDIPPKPWSTPRSSIPPTPSSRRTGDRDERTYSEKLSGLLEDVFEAEDGLPADPADDELPMEFFVPSTSGSLPLVSSSIVRKVTKLVSHVTRPMKRLGASPKKGGSEVDRESLSRMLKMLDRSMRAAQDVDPFPPPVSVPTTSSAATPSKKSVSPSKKKSKAASPEKEAAPDLDDRDINFDSLLTQLSPIYMSILAAECCLCILLHSGHQSLHSEELLSACFGAVKAALERVLYPFVEASSPHATHSEFNLAILSLIRPKDDASDKAKKEQARRLIGDIFQAVSSALPRIISFVNDDSLSHSALSESLIISGVYIAIGPFFVAADSDSDTGHSKSKAKESILSKTLGKAAMRGLRLDALGLIRSIFAHHQDQRSWIIEEVLSNLIKLNESGKQKSGQFRLRDGRQIKTSSALLLQLIQTSAHDVYLAGKQVEKNRQNAFALRKQESYASFTSFESQSNNSDDKGELLDEHDHEAMRLYAGGLEGATKAAGTIVYFLSSRSGKSKATKNTNEAEYRAILDSLINDLLIVLFQPEWPAASLILTVICKFMVSSLDDVKSHSSSDNNATKSIALDHLGIIAAKIRSTSLKVQNTLPSEVALPPMEEVVAQLDVPAFQKLLSAHRDLATLLCQKVAEDQAYVSARELTAVTLAHELAQSLKQVNIWLAGAEGEDDQDVDATQAIRDPEILRDLGGKIRSEMRDVWKNPTVDVFDVVSQEQVERVEKLAEAIGTIQGLRNSFQPILHTVLVALDSSAIFMRTKALRALEKIVTADATILSAGNVRRSIESHLLDSSPQVRDAAVELIGKYLVERPEVAGDYYSKIADRIADTGLAVRKRVIKLLKAFYGVTKDTSRQIDIATKLIFRMLDEDDSVKDLAIKTIEELWFTPSAPISTTKSRNATQTSSTGSKAALQNKVAVIMGVSANFKDRQSPLEDVLHKIITSKEGSEAQTLHQRYAEVCETLIDGLVDASDLPGFTLINCIRTTYLFTSAYPPVLSVSHAGTLLPYLKSATTPEEYATTDYLLKTFRAALPHMPKMAGQFGKDLQTILQPMIIKPSLVGGLNALQETVACMCSVIECVTHDFSRIAALLKSCNARLLSLMKKPLDTQRDSKTIMILIFIVSLLGEHCDFEQARAEYPESAKDLNVVSEGPIVHHIYDILLQLYGKTSEPSLRGRILQCLGFLFRAHPTLMTIERSAEIMDEIFTSNDDEARGRLLKIFQDFLMSESVKHAQKQKAAIAIKNQPSGINMEELVGNTDGFADSGVSSAVVQRYMEQILHAALSTNMSIQSSAIDILTFTVKQGLAHPLQSFPVIVSLETSPNTAQSNRAAALHSVLHSKHASLLNSRYTISARQSFDYQKSLIGGSAVMGYRIQSTVPVALLQRWYSLVREKRQSRQEFLKSLVKVFQLDANRHPSQDDVDFTRYMAENFSAFEYKTQEEVFTIIKFLTSVLSTTGMMVLEMVSPQNLLAQLHFRPEDETSMQVDSEENQDLIDKIPLMRTTIIIGMVMLLKAHLKALYSLSEEKCQKFDSNKKSAIGDKAALRRHQKPISWDRLPFTVNPILTSADVRAHKPRFLDVWNEDGIHGEPEEEEAT